MTNTKAPEMVEVVEEIGVTRGGALMMDTRRLWLKVAGDMYVEVNDDLRPIDASLSQTEG